MSGNVQGHMRRVTRSFPLRSGVLASLALGLFLAVAPARAELGKAEPVSDALMAPRPKGGEYFGLYLMGKKVGYLFTDLKQLPDGKVQAVNELVFKANVGTRVSERRHREVRVYESRPKGRLLSFNVEQKGDGGNQTLEAISTPHGLRVVQKRPGMPNQVLNLPAAKETVEDADQPRVALLRGQPMSGHVVDGIDLMTYPVSTTLGVAQDRMVNGVSVKLRPAVTLSEKEKVPVEALIAQDGAMVEINFGQTLQARRETESVAQRLDQVEVFGLTRVVLPKPLPPLAALVPGRATLVLDGLPAKFQTENYRQKFKQLQSGQVEVSLLAVPPRVKAPFPLKDPTGGKYLKSSLVVESDNHEIQAAAKKIAAGETDAYQVAKKVNSWVYKNVSKDYGASADRATDVLRQMKGDCTEHSLLMVSLLRALGVPARRVDGVIYMRQGDGVPALYWHEWVEAFVGEWTQMDPTFGQPVAEATHFALGEEGNAEITPLIGSLKVVDVR